MDLIVDSCQRVILTLVERSTNFLMMEKIKTGKKSEPIAEVQQITFAPTPSHPTAVEGATASGIILYPNPTQDRLVVQGAEGQTLRVYDLQGRLLKQAEGTEVQVEDLANGTYLLQIGTQVVRFIKQ